MEKEKSKFIVPASEATATETAYSTSNKYNKYFSLIE